MTLILQNNTIIGLTSHDHTKGYCACFQCYVLFVFKKNEIVEKLKLTIDL